MQNQLTATKTNDNSSKVFSEYNYASKCSKYFFPVSVDNISTMNSPVKRITTSCDVSSYTHELPETVSNEVDANAITSIPKSSQEKRSENVSSDKDDFENDDFQECRLENKFALIQNKKKNIESFVCVVCRSDLTNLDLENRAIHVNQCIDASSSVEIENSATSDVFILECPLCFKNFPTPEIRSSHIKKCGKSKGLSFQSIMQALQLQEKHVLERKALGLPLNKVKNSNLPKKFKVKKFTVQPKSAMQSDMQLAKALSLSLEEGGSQSRHTFPSSNDTLRMLQPPAESQIPGKSTSNKKMKLSHTPLLLLRTEEERSKIILDKVNAIITSMCQPENEAPTTESITPIEEVDDQRVSFLWDLTGKSENRSTYYVEQLIDWITPSDIDAGSKLCNLSQIAGHRVFTQLPCDYTFSCYDEDSNSKISPDCNQSPSLITSLQSLIGNFWMSDVDIHTASGIVIPAHKLLLAVRCPELRKVFDSRIGESRQILDWKNTSFDAALHFLNFIYTGSTEWKEDIMDELTELAKKYDVKDLLNILESDCGTLEIMSIENTQINASSPVKGNNFDDSSEKLNCITSEETMDVDKINSPIKSTVVLPYNNIESCEQSEGENKTLKAVSICNDIINRLNDTHSPLSSDYKTDGGIYSDFKLHQEPFKKNDANKPSTIHEVYNIDSSSNDSCKVLIVNNYTSDLLKINENSSCSLSEAQLKMDVDFENKETSLNVDSDKDHGDNSMKNEKFSTTNEKTCKFSFSEILAPLNSSDSEQEFKFKASKSVSSPPAINSDEGSCDDIVIIKDIEKKIYTEDCQSSIVSDIDNINRKSYSSFGMDNSASNLSYCKEKKLDGFATLSEKLSPKKSYLSSLSPKKSENVKLNLENNSEQSQYFNHAYDYNFTENGPLLHNCEEDTFENNAITSPEILTCDSDEDLDFSKSDRNICLSQKFTSSPSSIENRMSSKTKDFVPEIIAFNSDGEEVENAISPLRNSHDRESQHFSSRNLKIENIYFSESPKTISDFSGMENKVSLDKENNKIPEVIMFDSDEDDMLNNTQATGRYDLGNDKISMINSDEEICDRNKELPVFKSDDVMDKTLPMIKSDSVNDLLNQSLRMVISDDEYRPIHEEIHDRNKVLPVFKSDDEDDIMDKTLPMIKSDSVNDVLNQSLPIVISDDEYGPIHMENIKENESTKIHISNPNSPVSSTNCIRHFELSPDISNFKARIISQKSKNLDASQALSPDSPWVFKGKRSLEDFRIPIYHSSSQIINIKSSTSCRSKGQDNNSPTHKDKKKKCNNNQILSTPNSALQQFKLSDSPITPLPDYKSMHTPEIKDALKKIGVKALSRKKAVAVLSHVYEETHPWSGNATNLESAGSSTEPLTKKSKPKSVAQKRKRTGEKSTEATKIPLEPTIISPVKAASQNSSFSSPDFDSRNTTKDPIHHLNISSDFSDSSQPECKDKIQQVSNYISNNEELYKQILHYTPLNLVEFQEELKTNGISIGMKKLMDYLDEQCITFHYPRNEEYKKKQQLRTQRFRKRMITKLSQQTQSNS